MDDVAKRVGIAKSSLYLHTNARSSVVAQVFDCRLAVVRRPSSSSEISPEERWPRMLAALSAMGGPQRYDRCVRVPLPPSDQPLSS
jgi:hypothetical protein